MGALSYVWPCQESAMDAWCCLFSSADLQHNTKQIFEGLKGNTQEFFKLSNLLNLLLTTVSVQPWFYIATLQFKSTASFDLY